MTLMSGAAEASWLPRAGVFAGVGSLVRPSHLSACVFTGGGRLCGQGVGESLSSRQEHHNRI
jgi:hypothetical protein